MTNHHSDGLLSPLIIEGRSIRPETKQIDKKFKKGSSFKLNSQVAENPFEISKDLERDSLPQVFSDHRSTEYSSDINSGHQMGSHLFNPQHQLGLIRHFSGGIACTTDLGRGSDGFFLPQNVFTLCNSPYAKGGNSNISRRLFDDVAMSSEGGWPESESNLREDSSSQGDVEEFG